MARILIVYATREGQTAKIATRIGEHLGARGHDCVVHHAGEPFADQRPFELVVYGGSMHAGGIESELIEFMSEHDRSFDAAERAFFLVLLSAATRDPVRRAATIEDARRKTIRQLPIEFDEIEMIAGALMYSKYRWPMRWIMKRIAKEAGGDTDTSRDYEYTDWQQVRDYSGRLASRVTK